MSEALNDGKIIAVKKGDAIIAPPLSWCFLTTVTSTR